VNKYGLPRTIPSDIKRAVRQHCGFGCVVCGASIYEYDHFNPPYSEAEKHDPNGITLLCPTHHSEKTRGVLPIETVREFNSAPTAHYDGQTAITRPYFKHIPSLALGGGAVIENTPIPVMVRGVPLIEFLPPERGSEISRINAYITGEDGRSSLRIVENEWIVDSGVWDYEWVGRRMTIRDNTGSTALQITVYPPELIEIDRLRFNRDGFNVVLTRTELQINGSRLIDCIISNCPIGIALGDPVPAGGAIAFG
jgi:hypothetical protein